MSHQHNANTDNIRLAFFINLGFAVFELIGGLLTNSIAVLSDALHDLGDSLSLGFAWFMNRYSERSSDARYSYGYQRFSLLSALVNSAVLVGGSLFVLSETLQRLQNPQPFDTPGLIGIAIVGVAVNSFAALRLRGSGSLNARVLSWHLLEDVLGWAAVLIMGIISLFADVPILDPILSIAITVFILFNAVRNLIKTGRLFLQAVPQETDLSVIKTKLTDVEGVQSVHDVRLWSLDGEHHVLTAHLVVPPDATADELKRIKQDARACVGYLHLEDTALQLDFGYADYAREVEISAEKESNSHDH